MIAFLRHSWIFLPLWKSYKSYDDSVLIKPADIGQMIMVREEGDSAPDAVDYRHGLNPPMRDALRRRFRRDPDLNFLTSPGMSTMSNIQRSGISSVIVDISRGLYEYVLDDFLDHPSMIALVFWCCKAV
ncbi:hypothetical protein POM88_041895 [Heracleum sosnowskyi]|uniref:TAFII55 protein conserved region domain-containing protein n=1 Tax=Heracleum sosnowskyi TaxID=360622 RepID=A0AAD8MB68_9APIA|nr:hypothetical protein POM88_041895 [Heracleum sosnowskyi]